MSRINQKQCKDKTGQDSTTPAGKQCGKAKGGAQHDHSSEQQQCCQKGSQGSNAQSYSSKSEAAADIPSFCRKTRGDGCDQQPREMKNPCTDKAERDSAPDKQCDQGKRSQNDFSSKKQQCCQKRSQGPKAEQCSSNSRSEADTTSVSKQALEECDQQLREIKKKLCQAVCETRKIRQIVETNMQSESSETNSQGTCTSPPGKSTCKYKKLTTFLNIIGLAFLANIVYCIYKHGDVKENERRRDENSEERT